MKEKCWCIKGPAGLYYIEQTLSLNKGRAIPMYCYWHRVDGRIKSWKYWYRRGYRCEKVTLVEGWS